MTMQTLTKQQNTTQTQGYSFRTHEHGILHSSLSKAFLQDVYIKRTTASLPSTIEHNGIIYSLHLSKTLAYELKYSFHLSIHCLVSFQHFKDGRLIAVAKLFHKDKPIK